MDIKLRGYELFKASQHCLELDPLPPLKRQKLDSNGKSIGTSIENVIEEHIKNKNTVKTSAI
jgi:hypothetical protein